MTYKQSLDRFASSVWAVAIMAAVGLGVMPVRGAMLTQVTPDNSPEVRNTISVGSAQITGYALNATTSPVDGAYINPLPLVSSLPSYVSVNFVDNFAYSATSYSVLNIAGTDYTTTKNSHGATITFAAGAPASLQIGVLVNNSNSGWDVAFTADNSVVITNHYQTKSTNGFYFVTVSNIQPGDTVTIGPGSGWGGVVFAAVPEPMSAMLMGLGAMALLTRRQPARR